MMLLFDFQERLTRTFSCVDEKHVKHSLCAQSICLAELCCVPLLDM